MSAQREIRHHLHGLKGQLMMLLKVYSGNEDLDEIHIDDYEMIRLLHVEYQLELLIDEIVDNMEFSPENDNR